MNPFFLSLVVGIAFLSPFFALAEDASKETPCTAVLLACEDAGYIYDKVAEPGQKIWADCADPILNQNQKVRGVRIDPARVKVCRKYKQSKERWEADWEAHHPVDTD